jgi:hypothetical protein
MMRATMSMQTLFRARMPAAAPIFAPTLAGSLTPQRLALGPENGEKTRRQLQRQRLPQLQLQRRRPWPSLTRAARVETLLRPRAVAVAARGPTLAQRPHYS